MPSTALLPRPRNHAKFFGLFGLPTNRFGLRCVWCQPPDTEGVFYHGTFTLIGGKVGATWTVDGGGNKKSQNVNMTEEAFRGVWDSLNEIGDFKTGAVKDPQQALDPKTHHVVGVAYSLGGQMTTRTHMIPATSASPAFLEWLSKLGYPGK